MTSKQEFNSTVKSALLSHNSHLEHAFKALASLEATINNLTQRVQELEKELEHTRQYGVTRKYGSIGSPL